VALSEEELDTFRRLETRLGRERRNHHAPGGRLVRGLESLDAYYEGVQRIEALGLAVPPELERFTTIVNWPRIAVDSLEERLDVEGFRLPGADEADEALWAVWQANGLDEESQLAHVDALALRRSYVCVGSGEFGPDADDESRDPSLPLVTVESPFEMIHEDDPRTRLPRAVAKVYQDGSDRLGTFYLPGRTSWLEWRSGSSGRGWVEVDRDEHGIGIPVAPIVNRGRTAQRYGVSEMSDVIGLTDSAARALTNAQLATEIMAIPQRYVLGATKGDFVDADGNQLTAWEAYLGSVWALQNPDAKVGQFSAADLKNYADIVNHYATLVSGATGLPMRYLGSNTANPPSADAIRADEARLIKRAERRQRAWGGSWERVMRIVRRIQDGSWDPKLAGMETLWRDAATPTKAQAADAVVKLFQAGVIPRAAALEDIGYSATRRAKIAQQFAEEATDPVLERVARELAGNPQPAAPPVAGPVLNGAAGVA
jgi:hypothetical protein